MTTPGNLTPNDDREFADVERLIRAAANYIQPTDDLRPRTLEQAQDRGADRRLLERLSALSIAMAAVCLLSIPLLSKLNEYSAHTRAPSAAEIEQEALRLGTEASVGKDWGLSEAFSRLKQHQADQLNPSAEPQKSGLLNFFR